MFGASLKQRSWSLVRSLRVRATKFGRAVRDTPNARAKIGKPYDEIDDEFHAAYERARLALEHDVPVFVVLADELVFLHRGQRKSWSFSPGAYHLLKMISHGPLALFTSLQPGREAVRAEDAMGRRTVMRQWIDEARARLEHHSSGLQRETIADLHSVLAACARFLELPTERVRANDLDAFAAELGPILKRLIDAATQLQLDALHAHVEEALHELGADARGKLEVVVTGNHQARVRSLPMQYFKKRLRESAHSEDRVSYAEGVATERDALALIGTRRLDRELSRAFFADPQRMQRDLLGDAAEARLAQTELFPIA